MLHALIALAALAQPMVQMPVDGPLLPAGELVVMGPTAEGDLYVDPGSFERSDLPGLIRATGVVVRPTTDHDPAPLLVALVWVDCVKRQYQVSDGRLYDAGGRQVARTGFVRDKAFAAGSGPDRMAGVLCDRTSPDLDGAEVVADYNEALERTRSMDPSS